MSRVPVDWKGLSSAVLLEAGVYRDERGQVRVPYRLPGGAVYNEKVIRRQRSWWATSGLPLIPFGLEGLAQPDRREGHGIVITEGESDALAIRGVVAEWRGGRLDVLALPGAGTWRPEWRRYVVGYSRVYIVPDGDAAGQRMLERTQADVPGRRWVRVPDGRDSRGVIQTDGSDAFCVALADADLTACQWAAFRLAHTADEWVGHMQAMFDLGLWG